MKSTPPPRTIDEYLARVTPEQRVALEILRETIKKLAPGAIEVISYQIPTFKQHGALVGFAAFKNHCSFFVMSAALMRQLKTELEKYETATATIHFDVDKPLPATLVRKIVKARLQENEERAKRKQK